jgi:hypothetical protein
MFARFLVRERLREDDFTALLSGPRLRAQASRVPLGGRDRQAPRVALGRRSRLAPRPALLELFYSSGLRVSELAALTLQQVDLEGGFARVFGKGSKERVVPMGARARDALGTWIASGRPHFVKPRTRSELFLEQARDRALEGLALVDRQEARKAGRDHQVREAPPPAPHLRHPPPVGRGRPPRDPGDARATRASRRPRSTRRSRASGSWTSTRGSIPATARNDPGLGAKTLTGLRFAASSSAFTVREDQSLCNTQEERPGSPGSRGRPRAREPGARGLKGSPGGQGG